MEAEVEVDLQRVVLPVEGGAEMEAGRTRMHGVARGLREELGLVPYLDLGVSRVGSGVEVRGGKCQEKQARSGVKT